MIDRGSAPTPSQPTIPALLAARAAERPERVAILLDGTRSLTLAEWHWRSRQVACGLPERGIRPGDRVGLLFGGDDWIEYAVSYCAVLRAGGVAVPLFDNLPADRLQERLEHCAAVALVHSDGVDVSRLHLPTATVSSLEHGAGSFPDDSGPDPFGPSRGPADPDALAEIIYLSGGGRPRGVAGTHADILFGQSGSAAEPPFGDPGYVLCCFPIGTVTGQWALVRSLTGCGTALMASDFAPDHVGRLIASHRPDAVLLAPATATALFDTRTHLGHDLSSVRWAGCGATPLLPASVKALRAVFPNATLVDHYGSIESAPAVTRMMVDPDRPGAVGKPIDGAELIVAGKDDVPLPPGRVGEVLLRSAAPPRRYYLDASASASTSTSTASTSVGAGARGFDRSWTRMGDLGYLDPDGYLHLVERPAEVISSGGLTVSTPQVEAALFEHPSVADAAVVGVGHPVIDNMVAAVVVPRQDIAPAELRDFLRGRLVEYELPTQVLVVPAVPRDGMGKVRTDEVRALVAEAGDAAKIAPSSPVEAALAMLWTQVLAVPVTGVDDDFFLLGGDSVKAAQLAARAERTFGVRATASLVFDVPVLAHQAGWLASRMSSRMSPTARPAPRTRVTGPTPASTGAPAPALADGSMASTNPSAIPSGVGAIAVAVTVPLTRSERRPVTSPEPLPEERSVVRVPLSPFQERSLMWMFGGSRPQRRMPQVASMRISERIDPRTMRRSLNELAYRQEALRTVFAPICGRYEALTLPDCLPNFVSIRARGATLQEREEHARKLAREYVERPFDIVRGPLFRALMIQLGDEDNVLVLCLDRLITDGLSIEVLLRELGLIHAAFRLGQRSPLPPVELRCSDFFAWVRQQYGRTRGYWERALAGAPAAMGPLPGQNTATRTYSNSEYDFEIPAEVGNRLRGAYPEHGVTAFMAGIAAWSGVLSSWTKLPEIVLLSPMSGRTRPEFESLVGSILQSPFFRLRTTGDPTFNDLLIQARRSVVAATEHQFYPHHEFLSRVPYPARFNLYDRSRPARLPGLDCAPFQFSATLVPDRALDDDETDLHIPRLGLGTQPDGSMRGNFTYNGCAFKRDVIERLARDFVRFAGGALENPDRRLSELV